MACPHDEPARDGRSTEAERNAVALGGMQIERLLDESRTDRLPESHEWAAVARGVASPGELLERLRGGEGLALDGICCAVLRDERMLMAPEMLVRRAQVQVALASMFLGGEGDLREWLGRQVTIALFDGLEAELRAELAGEPIVEDERCDYALFHDLFGVDPSAARGLMLRFAGLAATDRAILFELIVRRRGLAEVADRMRQSAAETRAAFEHGLIAVGALGGASVELGAPWNERLERLKSGVEAQR